jgi:hypothetical protein
MKSAILVLLFLPAFLKSQTTSTIYGLARNFNPAQIYLASMQPGTGVVTEISPSSIAQGYALNPLSAIDPVNNKFFFSVGGPFLFKTDLSSGLPDTLALNIPTGSYFDLMQYNCADSSLYGIYRTVTPAELFLSKVDVNTGGCTIISPVSVGQSYSLTAKSTLDPVNGVFYFIAGSNNGVILTGVDIVTGLTVSQTGISFTGPGEHFDMLTYNCNDGIMYGISRSSSQPAIYPAIINPVTGVVTNLSNTSMGQGILANGMSEINPFTNVFHFFNGSFQSYDLTTGNILPTPALSFSSPPGNIYFDLIARDNCKCVLSNPSLNIAEAEGVTPMRVFPNPAATGTMVSFSFPALKENAWMQIIDVNGKSVFAANVTRQTSNITLNDIQLAPGIYQVYIPGVSSGRFIITE